jgi:hypothetical protein
MFDAENGPLKFVLGWTLTVSVLSPDVEKDGGLPVQVTVPPDDGELGVH